MLEQNLFRLRSSVLFPLSPTVFLLTHRSAMILVSSRVLEIMRINTEKVWCGFVLVFFFKGFI